MSYHVGIDPGGAGGIGIIDGRGQFVAAHRWQAKAPARLYQLLLTIRGDIYNSQVYLERIQAHPGEGLGHVVNNMALVENYGLWQGFALAAGLVPVLVHPITWQNAHGLRNWQAAQKLNAAAPGPLDMARRRWPGAPLEFLADDGKAVALLLAFLAFRDRQAGIDRAALNESREIKAKAQRAKARRKRRELKAQPPAPGPPPGGPAPALCSALPGDWPPALPPAPLRQNKPAPAPQVAPLLDFDQW